MARRRPRMRARRGRRNRFGRGMLRPAMTQAQNDVIKGLVTINSQVDLNVNDFDDLKLQNTSGFQLIRAKVNVSTTGVTDCFIAFYDSKARNTCYRSVNINLCNNSRTVNFKFPPRTYRAGTELNQICVQIVNCAISQANPMTTDIPIAYSCELWVRRTENVFASTVDPPHVKRKHGVPIVNMPGSVESLEIM